MSIETALQCAAIACALLMVFGFSNEREFQLFYVLFLPIVWMAVRNGIEGVSAGILITQCSLILGVGLLPEESKELNAYQALMLVLAVTGLIAGALVTERRRTETQSRLHQESLARLARLGSISELATAVAHEVNHPLMAAGTYIRLVADAISSGNIDTAEVAETAKEGRFASRSRRRGNQTSAGVGTARSQQSCAGSFRTNRQANDRFVQA